MTEERKYKVLQLDTTGWVVPDDRVDANLTREECNSRLRWYLDQGISPDRIKAGVYIPE
tara:strand:- start:431 stop:607 length:177 start_codon:yes stop_codon:yes gene_type:complete